MAAAQSGEWMPLITNEEATQLLTALSKGLAVRPAKNLKAFVGLVQAGLAHYALFDCCFPMIAHLLAIAKHYDPHAGHQLNNDFLKHMCISFAAHVVDVDPKHLSEQVAHAKSSQPGPMFVKLVRKLTNKVYGDAERGGHVRWDRRSDGGAPDSAALTQIGSAIRGHEAYTHLLEQVRSTTLPHAIGPTAR